MGNLKKINIYVGTVGQAYVDKETAKNNLDSAKQNINDWDNIIVLAQSVLNNTNPISNRLTDAKSKANAVKTLLETEMNNATNNTEKYNALKKLRDELLALDHDNDFSNGGNTYTLDQIDNAINSIITEINDILSKSQSNKTYWEGAVAEYQQAYDTAKEVFNSYIPEDQNNSLDEKDELEVQFTERLHEIDVQLQEFDTAISKVNEVSDKANQEIKKITGTVVPDEPSNPEVQNNCYIGFAQELTFTESDLNKYVATKPETIELPVGTSDDVSIWIYPKSWGKPIEANPIIDGSVDTSTNAINLFTYSSRFNLPEGYIGCYLALDSATTYKLTWQ